MLKITCCRIGKYSNINIHGKGMFVKEFKNLSEMAMWIHKCRCNIWFPMINQELTKGQLESLNKKTFSANDITVHKSCGKFQTKKPSIRRSVNGGLLC